MMCDVLGEFFIFQQDSASFIPQDLWPPNSPDLNPVDYKIWSVVQQRVYQSRPGAQYWRTQAAFGARLVYGMDQTIIDSAIDEWRGRLCACVREKGGHFEQMLWHLLRRLSFSSVTINASFVTLCQYHTIYRVHLCDFKEIWTLEFPKVVCQHK